MPEMVRMWTDKWQADIAESASSPAVQSAETMLAEVEAGCDRLHSVADKVYSRWIQGLVHS
jgi:hypothetical protein